jgi:hypothetical protein
VAAAPTLPILFERALILRGLLPPRQLPRERRISQLAAMKKEMARRVSVTASAVGPQGVDYVA